MEIIVIQKKQYAFGLSPWLALPSRGNPGKLASKKTKDLKGKGFCLRPSPIPQVGIANEWSFSKNGELIKGMGFRPIYSLATAIAGNQPESWAGLFHMTEKSWWVISVMNGVIVPDGDYLTEDESTARKFYDMEVSRLSQEVAPIEINDVAESIRWIETHLSTRYVGKLQKNGIDQKQIVMAGAAGLILVAGTGGYLWHAHEVSVARAKARQALLIRMRQEELQKKQEQKKMAKLSIHSASKPLPRPKPWAGKPLFSAYANAVHRVFDRVPLQASGWGLTSLKCNTSVCTATYKREAHVATFWFRPKGTLPNLSTKTVSRNYPLRVGANDGTQHVGRTHLSVWLMGWMQVHGIIGSVTAAPAYQAPYMPQKQPMYTNPLQGGKTIPKYLPPTWKSLSWTIRSILPPWQLNGISVNGVVPESADYSVSGGQWAVVGGAYEPIK